MIGLIGKKIGMTTIFGEDRKAVPVTILQAGPCEIVQEKTPENEGYTAVQLGFDPTKEQRVTKPLLGHFHKAGTKVYKKLKEIRLDKDGGYEVGQLLTVEQFAVGDNVSLSGVTKGKGFQGGVTRWGFAGGPKTHGQSNKFRAPGSLGQSSSPSRVFKGMKMAGHMGARNITRSGSQIVAIDPEENLILVRGVAPGPKNGYIIIRKR
jgi:large subunit ribosomal protein L3